MPVDASIVLGIKPAEIPNQLDQAAKAASLMNLTAEAQSHRLGLIQQQRALDDDTALRNTYAKYTIPGPDGTPMVDVHGAASDLASQGRGHLAIKMSLDATKNQIEQRALKLQAAKPIVFGITNQKNYEQAISQLEGLGLPVDDFPPQYDPGFVSFKQKKFLTGEDQVRSEQKAIDQHIAQTGQQIQLAKLNQDERHFRQGHEQQANQNFITGVESSRQSPDVKQALTDIYQANKFDLVTKPYIEDLNDMPLTQVKLAVQEASKMAKGGASTEGEFMMMVPDTRKTRVASAMERIVSGKPEKGDVGEFMQLYVDYIKDLKNNAVGLASRSYFNNLEQNAKYMDPKSVDIAKTIGLKKFLTVGGEMGNRGGEEKKEPMTAGVDVSKIPALRKAGPKEGETKSYNGKTFKVMSGHWVEQ